MNSYENLTDTWDILKNLCISGSWPGKQNLRSRQSFHSLTLAFLEVTVELEMW